jgi:hypothetical protein
MDKLFPKLFSVDLYETQTLGPLCIVEIYSDFTKAEVKDFIRSMKNNTATGYDGVPAEF